MYELMLFDLDGTLVDTAPDIADTVNRLLDDRGLPPVAEDWVRNRIGNGTRALLSQAFARTSEPDIDQLLEQFRRHYAAHCGHRGRLYPDAARTLTMLRNAGLRLALITNKETQLAEFVLQVHGLDGDFDLLICGDTLRARKPDALTVRHCLEHFGAEPQNALMIGDSDIDVQTARNAGIAIWAVPWGYNQDRPIAESKPDRIIESFSELLVCVHIEADEAA